MDELLQSVSAFPEEIYVKPSEVSAKLVAFAEHLLRDVKTVDNIVGDTNYTYIGGNEWDECYEAFKNIAICLHGLRYWHHYLDEHIMEELDRRIEED